LIDLQTPFRGIGEVFVELRKEDILRTREQVKKKYLRKYARVKIRAALADVGNPTNTLTP